MPKNIKKQNYIVTTNDIAGLMEVGFPNIEICVVFIHTKRCGFQTYIAVTTSTGILILIV